ncbi:hypothetical protein LF1_23840 [Rubripirellula obstinata]|uniref:Secreted protein n=3 Tax=Rubripirellula obstinata TaxID=406547 RepID=A0A5B1CF84_9BACT|nr:hypothetical protein LF1_23840 [Rubripirellula obstinata]
MKMKRFACAFFVGVSALISIPGCGGGGEAQVQNTPEDQKFYEEQIAKDEAMDKAAQ